MRTVTLKMDEETVEDLDTEAERHGYSSRSEYMRDILETRNDTSEYENIVEEYKREIKQYQDDIEEYEREIERQHRERRQVLDLRDEHQDLVRAVEEEQSIAQKRAQAGVFTRAKWWFTGMPNED